MRMNFDRLWERHKNPISWVLRPVFGAVMFYGAWIHDLLLIGIGIIGLSTSWFWFPKPKKVNKSIARFIEMEKKFVSPPWTNKKILALVFTIFMVALVIILLWFREAEIGLWIFILASLMKAAWSYKISGKYGKWAIIIGILSALIAGVILITLYLN